MAVSATGTRASHDAARPPHAAWGQQSRSRRRIDSLTLATAAHRRPARRVTAPRDLARRAARSDRAAPRPGGGGGLAARRVRRGRVRRPGLPRQPRQPLLLLQDQPVRRGGVAHAAADRVRHQHGRPRRVPPRPGRGAGARGAPPVRGGRDRQAHGARAGAPRLGLGALAELPSAPCLSSRIETGIRIEAPVLAMVHAAETLVAARLSPRTVRCRVRAGGVVIELDPAALAAVDAAGRTACGRRCSGWPTPPGCPRRCASPPTATAAPSWCRHDPGRAGVRAPGGAGIGT